MLRVDAKIKSGLKIPPQYTEYIVLISVIVCYTFSQCEVKQSGPTRIQNNLILNKMHNYIA